MKPLLSLIEQPIRNYRKWDFLVFTLITAASIVQGQSTVFYVLYFFWWNELIRIVVDRMVYRKNPNAQVENVGSIGSSLFMMGIYWVFLVVFFGFIANWDNRELSTVNFQILFFQNWFFNANLIFVVLERLFLHQREYPLRIRFGGFTRNMILLHVSIILGGILMFFVVKNYPDYFTPDNPLGSLLIISPFLLIRLAVDWFSAKS